ncbi:murein biosynthesis integral membrane protein MurJ [Undibacterium sp.]|uniref:murein biosynthesis integral membrane protein MurJ n=1 Tax=Undibacterium sp. TaxID=1914977 RepID=UPI0025DD6DCE|nr:murein biosynthesis integral membrane protein MurJ [Undibacterium sp.]
MNLLKTLATISGMTMLSRITGLIRDVLINSYFGASGWTDAYFAAMRIPNFFRRLFAEGAFSQAFVPILAEYKNKKGDQATRELVDHVATVLVWALLFTCLIGVAGAPIFVYMFASGFAVNPAKFEITVVMTRIMFPYIGFISLVALASGILNTWREFRVPAFTPVLLNLSSIAASLFLAPHMAQPIYALAIAVFVGGVLQMLIQVPALIKIGMLPRLSLNPMFALRDPGVLRVLRQMGPAVLAVSATQISILINSTWASHMPDGSMSWLASADRLMEFPTALLGVALGTVLLPSLSKANAEADTAEYSSLLDWGLRLTCLLAMPAAVALATLPEALTATLFHNGKFDAHAVAMTAQAVTSYGVGLIGLIFVKILAPGFYAKQDIRTPVKIAIIVLLATQVMNLMFVPFIQHAGLALSVGLGACLNASMLYRGLRQRGIYAPQAGWLPFLLKLAAALTLMAGVALALSGQVDWIGLKSQKWMRAGLLGGIILACMLSYFLALFAMGFRIRDFRKTSS